LKKFTDVSRERDASVFIVLFDMKLEASRSSETPINIVAWSLGAVVYSVHC
jgi:hypothetical protein